MSLILAYKSRDKTLDITIQDADAATITPGGSDKVRVMIGREGEPAKLSFTSDAATTNGSSITKGAANRLVLKAADLAFDAGTYTFFVDYYDSDGSGWKNVDRQVFVLEET